jgi:NADPH:quinone reductase-like Zn-dependent oxidoreductase
MMRAISVSEYRADVRLGEYDKPTAGPGQVLVKVQAAGMNPMDQAIASGAFSEFLPATFPLILGVDVAGIVEAVGDGPGPYSVSDRVFGQSSSGSTSPGWPATAFRRCPCLSNRRPPETHTDPSRGER